MDGRHGARRGRGGDRLGARDLRRRQGRWSAGNSHFPDARAGHWTLHGFDSGLERVNSEIHPHLAVLTCDLVTDLERLHSAGLQPMSLLDHATRRCLKTALLSS